MAFLGQAARSPNRGSAGGVGSRQCGQDARGPRRAYFDRGGVVCTARRKRLHYV